jgi:hypothetical protein
MARWMNLNRKKIMKDFQILEFIRYGTKDRLWFEMKDGKVIGFGMNPAIG